MKYTTMQERAESKYTCRWNTLGGVAEWLEENMKTIHRAFYYI